MAALNFDVQAFESQQLPEALPAPAATRTPDTQADAVPELTAEQQASLGLHSEFIGLMDTHAKVLEHWRLLSEQRKQQAVADAAARAKEQRYNPELRAQRIRSQAEHDLVVNQANLEWRNAIAERKRVLQEQDAKVEAARLKFRKLKAEGPQ